MLRRVKGLVQGHSAGTGMHAQPYMPPNAKLAEKSEERP